MPLTYVEDLRHKENYLTQKQKMEELQTKHRLEKKELQATIQKIKHAAPKGDKKRQKHAKEEILKLETEMATRHDHELKALECSENLSEISLTERSLEQDEKDDTVCVQEEIKPAKKSKAAKRREKKEQEERERDARIQAGAIETLSGARHIEQQLISSKLVSRNLILHDIPSDGDCLYKAIAHQLSIVTKQAAIPVSELRGKVASEMREHSDEYLPFITTASGDLLDAKGFEDYCDKLENTPEWGGQPEIKAMNVILGYPVLVIQGDLPDILIGDGTEENSALTVVYHKRLYELGEHYNSVIPSNDAESS